MHSIKTLKNCQTPKVLLPNKKTNLFWENSYRNSTVNIQWNLPTTDLLGIKFLFLSRMVTYNNSTWRYLKFGSLGLNHFSGADRFHLCRDSIQERFHCMNVKTLSQISVQIHSEQQKKWSMTQLQDEEPNTRENGTSMHGLYCCWCWICKCNLILN